MKKTLFVLGFALCASFAFAQTNARVAKSDDLLRARDVNANMTPAQERPVDYKASIFTKDANFDTLRTFTFDDTDMADPQLQFGFVAAGANIVVDGVDSILPASAAHSVDVDLYPWAQFHRFANVAAVEAAYGAGQMYSGLNNYFPMRYIGQYLTGGNDGLMMIGYNYFVQGSGVGIVNTYFTLPAVSHPTRSMVMIHLTQAYRKFADYCYVEYQLNNKWYATEINVNGVDAATNEYSAVRVGYTMPFALADVQSLNLRVRVYAKKYAAYGYGWAFDDLAVVANTSTESWSFNTPAPLDGFYGTMPQGMTIPVAYGMHVRNTSIDDITNAYLTLKDAPANGTWGNPIPGTQITVEAGNVEADHNIFISERGFLIDTIPFNYGSHSWMGYYDNYGVETLTGDYLARGLRTNTPGMNFYTVNAQGGSLTRSFDTILYTVSSNLDCDDQNLYPGRVSGYRWSRDNGLIPSGSAFAVSFTDDGYIDNDDVAEDGDGHSNMAGYYLTVRFTTGSTIPTDNNNRPWVFRGVEYVPSTNRPGENMITADPIFQPLIWEEEYWEEDGSNWRRFNEVACGIDNMTYGVSASDVSDLPQRGYKLPPAGVDPNYSAINVEFPDQPTLKPNTSYRFGYYLTETAQFNLAATSDRFIREDVDSSRSYLRDEATAPYYNQNNPIQPYEIIVVDGNGASISDASNHTIYGWNVDSWPMIRPIVGPYQERPTVDLYADCSTNQGDLGVSVVRGADDICGVVVPVAEGSNQTLIIAPLGQHTVIDKIFINGEEIPVYTGAEGEEYPDSYFLLRMLDGQNYDYNVYDAHDNVILARSAYELRLYELPANAQGYTITATFRYEEWGIDDPIADFVGLKLAPNPATSSVKMNIQGVNGMVNCSIIDMSGRVVYNANVNAEAETTLNVSSMPAGAYFVRITNDSFSKVEKLIIK